MKAVSYKFDDRFIELLNTMKVQGFGDSASAVIRKAVALAATCTPGQCADAYAAWLVEPSVASSPTAAASVAAPAVYERAPRPGSRPSAEVLVVGTMLCAQDDCPALVHEGGSVLCDEHAIPEEMTNAPEF